MSEFKLIHPAGWNDYELIDSGAYEKLERFGDYILSRPEPQACWNKSLSETQWEQSAHARFIKAADKEKNTEKGRWVFLKKMPEQWFVNYAYKEMKLRFRLGLTAFKHVGLFPEQSDNWNFIYDTLNAMHSPQAKVLNLFAYTGGATLAAKAAGAEVVHVDSVKQVVNWSHENMDASGLDNIRWVVEDVMKYVRREVKRGNRYNGIILDPPAYGRGPEGEKWVLEDDINELMQHCAELLSPGKGFVVLNLYSMGFSALVANNLIDSFFTDIAFREFGEFYFPDHSGKKLPLGTFIRMRNLTT
jgi:23S rRNA (cytosine1962-C5)-methyltransferase